MNGKYPNRNQQFYIIQQTNRFIPPPPASDYRVTESGERRITESGDYRVTQLDD